MIVNIALCCIPNHIKVKLSYFTALFGIVLFDMLKLTSHTIDDVSRTIHEIMFLTFHYFNHQNENDIFTQFSTLATGSCDYENF